MEWQVWSIIVVVALLLLRHRSVRKHERGGTIGTKIVIPSTSPTTAHEVIKHHRIQNGMMTYIRGITPTSGAYHVAEGDAPFLLMIFPGNPGSADFYVPFMRYLSIMAAGRLHIECVSHLGHAACSGNNGRIYSLEEQVQHKILYIRQLLKQQPRLRIALAGHSIGAYFCLRMLRDIPEHRFVATYLLFPTIMDMAQSPNGKFQSRFYRWPFRKLLGSIAWCLSLLPFQPSISLATMYIRSMNAAKYLTSSTSTPHDEDLHIRATRTRQQSYYSNPYTNGPNGTGHTHKSHSKDDAASATAAAAGSGRANPIVRSEENAAISVMSLLRSSIAQNALSMAQEEMRDMGDIVRSSWGGDRILASHHPHIRAIWSACDAWAPLSYLDRLEVVVPEWKGVHRDTLGLPHAFVVDDRASQAVARLMWQWLAPLLSTTSSDTHA